MGYLKNLGSPWIRPHSLFSTIFNGLLFGWTLRMFRPSLKSVRPIASPVPEIIAIGVLGGNCEPPILGGEGRVRARDGPFERALVRTSYRPSTVTVPLSLCVSEIPVLSLLCSSAPLSPPTSSPQNFPMLPWK